LASSDPGVNIKIRSVRSDADLDAFIRLPWDIYQDDTNWVPPLISAERKLVDRSRNPFFKNAEAEYFLAEEDGRLVGRLGPANPSLNDPCGILIDGFNWPPFVLMTHNPRYYPEFMESAGYQKSKDLLAFLLLHDELDREKIGRVSEIVRKRSGVTVRNMDLRKFEQELDSVMEIYNDAWSNNWGFTPMTEDEIRYAADDMKAILLPELTFIAEKDGEPVGFALALPNINPALRKCNGSLLPFGWFHFLKFRLRKIPTFRIIALGVKQELQHLGIGTLFYQRYIEDGLRMGYRAAELSWILENNDLMTRPMKQLGARSYKTYRLYEKTL
jgi:GNAT superfamily N-acetyltransferase